MPRSSQRTLIFDLDGTLSDPVVGIGRSMNAALVAHGYPEADDATISRWIGPQLDIAFRALAPGVSEDGVTGLVAAYRARYWAVGYAENVVYPGIEDALSALTARGVRLGVCSSKRTDVADRVLSAFNLRHYFAFVDGGDIGVSKGDQLRRLVTQGLDPASAVMVGDRAVDVLAAKQNALASVGVLWGHGSREELTVAQADVLLESPSQLCDL